MSPTFFRRSKHCRQIICLSSTRWSFLWQRPQQIMSRLSQDFDILYVDPPFPVAAEQVMNVANDTSGVLIEKNTKVIHNSLRVFTPLQISQISRPELQPEERETLNRQLLRPQIETALSRIGWKKPLLWIYDPENAWLAECLNTTGVIYDCVDSFRSFSWSHPDVSFWDDKLVKVADVVLTTSKALYQERVKINKNTYLVPNAADYLHFARSGTLAEPSELSTISRPRLGFIGAIYEWVDLPLLATIADRSPNWSIVLVGPKQHGLQLPERKNIYWLGQREYNSLPAYLHSYDVALIPFLNNETTRHANPIKFWEYLAAGKPVVSTSLPEIPRKRNVVWPSIDAEEFYRNCGTVLRLLQKGSVRARVAKTARSIARKNSWERRCKTICLILRQYF